MSGFTDLQKKAFDLPERVKRSFPQPRPSYLGLFDLTKRWMIDLPAYQLKAEILSELAKALEDEAELTEEERRKSLFGAYLYILSTLSSTGYQAWINQTMISLILKDLSLDSLEALNSADYQTYLRQFASFLANLICNKDSATSQKLFKPERLPDNIQLILSKLIAEPPLTLSNRIDWSIDEHPAIRSTVV